MGHYCDIEHKVYVSVSRSILKHFEVILLDPREQLSSQTLLFANAGAITVKSAGKTEELTSNSYAQEFKAENNIKTYNNYQDPREWGMWPRIMVTNGL